MPVDQVLVSGATGFLGRAVCRDLIADGRHVHALVRSAARARALPEHSLMSVHVVRSATEAAGIVGALPLSGIVHLATRFVARHSSPDQLVEMLEANVELGSLLGEVAARRAIPLVSASSVWQHFEGRPYSPVSLYAATKQAQDDILLYYAEVEDLLWTRVVLGDTYGPGDDRGKLLSQVLQAARTGVPLVASSGHQLWDPVHSSDVVRAFRLCLDLGGRDPGAATYQLRSADPVTVRRLVEILEQVVGHQIPVQWGARPDRGREMTEPWVVAGPPPGWSPVRDLVEGLTEVWESAGG